MVVANSKIEQWWGDWKISFAENWKEDERLINWIRNRVRVAGGAHYQSICAILGNKLVFIYFIYLFIKILNFVIYLVLMKGKERKGKLDNFLFPFCVLFIYSFLMVVPLKTIFFSLWQLIENCSFSMRLNMKAFYRKWVFPRVYKYFRGICPHE